MSAVLAQPVEVPHVVQVTDVWQGVSRLYETGLERGKSTGWSSLDEWWTVRKKELTVITGHPNHGKSTWLDNLLVHLAQLHGWKIGIFSAENQPVERHIASLAEIYLGRPFSKGPTPRMSRESMMGALTWIDLHFKFINPELQKRSVDTMLAVGEQLVSFHGCDVLVLDPWNELDHTRPRQIPMDEHISIELSRIRDFTRLKNVHFFIVAHPAKMKREPGKPAPVATMYEIKGAQEWNSKADNGISIYRDPQRFEDGTDVHVQKVRFREVGKAGGGCKLQYDMVTGRFIDPYQKPTIDDYVKRQQREPGDDDQ